MSPCMPLFAKLANIVPLKTLPPSRVMTFVRTPPDGSSTLTDEVSITTSCVATGLYSIGENHDLSAIAAIEIPFWMLAWSLYRLPCATRAMVVFWVEPPTSCEAGPPIDTPGMRTPML